MYSLTNVIPNEKSASLIPEVSFHPSGSVFAVSYHNNNEVRIFDASTRSLVRIYRNPEAHLDGPHGVVVSDNHIIVSNSHCFQKPSRFNVFRTDDPSAKPVSTFETPFTHLREAHSLALRNSRLVATYCENLSKTGAVVSYRFDDENGLISEPVHLCESVFRNLGDTKGVSFNADGSKILVSFNTRRVQGIVYKIRLKFIGAGKLWNRGGLKAVLDRAREKALSNTAGQPPLPPILKNGIAVFAIDEQGVLSKEPDKVIIRQKFCRLENINLVGDTCIIADTINNKVHLHDFQADPELEKPYLTLSENFVLPHGVKLSPNKRVLVITNFGLQVKNGFIQWKSWASPRQDKVLVYELRQ